MKWGLIMPVWGWKLLFFGVVSPFAVAFRLISGDPLKRAPDQAAASYWVPVKGQSDLTSER